MNVYDFDDTIYDGNSSIDFFAFCLLKNYRVLKYTPILLYRLLKYHFGLLDLTKDQKSLCKFLKAINDLDKEVALFWNENFYKIQKWYLDIKSKNDVIITSSPLFLVKPLCARLDISNVIGTEIDLKTGDTIGNICRGEEKLKQFKKIYGENTRIDKLYIDSFDGEPLTSIANKVYILNKGKITKEL